MTRFDDLDRALTSYFDIEAAAPAPQGLLESAMSTTERRRPRPAWSARLHAGNVAAPRGETARTLAIAAALVAADIATDIPDGITRAAEAIDSGAAKSRMTAWVKLSRSFA